MKKTFLRILPVVAAVLLAASCSKDNDGVDTPQTVEPTIMAPEQPAEQAETVKIPFSVKIADGESISKITYAPAKDGGDNDIWNKVTRAFDDDDLAAGTHPISLTINGETEGSGITESTLALTKDDGGNYYFEGATSRLTQKRSRNSTEKPAPPATKWNKTDCRKYTHFFRQSFFCNFQKHLLSLRQN